MPRPEEFPRSPLSGCEMERATVEACRSGRHVFCRQGSPSGWFVCTREPGHSGAHLATVSSGSRPILERWT